MSKWLVRKTLESIFPPSDDLAGISDAELDAFLDQFNQEAPPVMRVAIVACAAAYNVSTPLTVGLPIPAALLPKRLLDLHAQRAAYSRIYLLRQVVLLLKTVGGMCWGANPEIRSQLGLDPYSEDPGTWRRS